MTWGRVVPAAELVRLAARRGIHVWKHVPLARSLGEGAELCRVMDSDALKFAVGTTRRFTSSYRKAREMLPRIGEVHLAQAHYQFDVGAELTWRGDKAAGGGALIELGYHMFDLLIWLLGVPEAVYCVTGTGRLAGPSEDLPVYDSDDTAVAMLRYGGKVTATVTVSRSYSPVSEGLTVYGQAGTLLAGADHCELRDRKGVVLDSFDADGPPAAVFDRMIHAFVDACSGADRYECSAWENLRTMATVDSAYLSDQTG
ncbi:hypothetical protein LCGC14_2222820, partial [marine sediment metagenome]